MSALYPGSSPYFCMGPAWVNNSHTCIQRRLEASNLQYTWGCYACDDVIILTDIETHSERWTQFTQAAFVCQVRSISTAIALPYAQSIWVFPWESTWKIQHIIKCYRGWFRSHLAVSTESVSSQTNESCLCKLSWPFTMGLYGSQYHYIICVALITISHISLIASFQPPDTYLTSYIYEVRYMYSSCSVHAV